MRHVDPCNLPKTVSWSRCYHASQLPPKERNQEAHSSTEATKEECCWGHECPGWEEGVPSSPCHRETQAACIRGGTGPERLLFLLVKLEDLLFLLLPQLLPELLNLLSFRFQKPPLVLLQVVGHGLLHGPQGSLLWGSCRLRSSPAKGRTTLTSFTIPPFTHTEQHTRNPNGGRAQGQESHTQISSHKGRQEGYPLKDPGSICSQGKPHCGGPGRRAAHTRLSVDLVGCSPKYKPEDVAQELTAIGKD